MLRKLAVLALLLLATIASARTRAVAGGGGGMDEAQRRAAASSVSGIVTSVNGNVIALAGGLVTIDATGAHTTGTIEPGAMVFATVTNDNGTLRASNVLATRIADATITGTVDHVDTTNHTLTVLGRTITITNDTSIGGMAHRDGGLTLGDIVAGELVAVQAENVNGHLVATTVIVLAPIAPQVDAVRGTVKSIGTDSWVIEREGGAAMTFTIDAHTKITGTPKVGDTVEVLYRIDSAHANIAVAIVKFERPQLPTIPDLARVTGVVKSIDGKTWTIGETKVVTNDHTKIEPGIHVGDSVEAVGEKHSDGSVTAVFIVKKRM